MNKQYLRSTEAYSNFFLKLSKVFEDNEVATSERKLRREAATRRLALAKKRVAMSKFNSVEASAREFNLGELEQLLVEQLRQVGSKKNFEQSEEPIILFELSIPRGWNDPFSLAALAFRVSRISGLSINEFVALLIGFLGWLVVPNLFFNLIFSAIALSFALLKFYGRRNISITASRSIKLPELRLLFKELKAMHLSPYILIELGYESRDLEVSLLISPDWHRLKNLL